SGRLTATAGHCTTQRTTHYEIFDVGIYPLIKRRVIQYLKNYYETFHVGNYLLAKRRVI
ncbi:unnamed protein product, partial [Rotaria sordida]